MKTLILLSAFFLGCQANRTPSSIDEDQRPAHERYNFNPANQ